MTTEARDDARPPPPAEAALIATLLAGDPVQLDAAAEILTAGDFADARCGATYETMLHLGHEGRRIDTIIVAEALKATGRLATVGGPRFLASLEPPAFANVTEWARTIREAGGRRQLATLAKDVHALAQDPTVPLSEALDVAGRRLNDVHTQRQQASFMAMPALVDEFLGDLDARRKHGGLVGVPTGLPDVDRLLLGFQEGDLVVLAARPGVGKTTFALQMATHVASSGTAVGVFSLEMPAKQLLSRLFAAEARVGGTKMRTARLSPAEEERITEAAERLYKLPIHVDATGSLSPYELRAKARRLKQQHPSLGLLVVDYLQLMKLREKTESRQVEIAEISRALKEIAKTLALPVLALSQLNREIEKRRDRRPMLSDLRESGAIEQDADTVLFLWGKDEDEDDTAAVVPVELTAAKVRNGETGEVGLSHVKAQSRFEGRAYNYTERR